MKHKIRNRIINQYGLPVTKIETVYGELGSGIIDIYGREIFEGDIVKDEYDQTSEVVFSDGCLIVFDVALREYDATLEVVGHVDADELIHNSAFCEDDEQEAASHER